MITTANYIVKAIVDGEVFIFQYDQCGDAWEALEKFWHEDYPETLIDKGGPFPIDVIAMDGGKAIRTYEFTFNGGVFHAFFDHGHTASGPYTLDQFAKDIERSDKEGQRQLVAMMNRWGSFCYNHPPYEDVILWMVGGSKSHYLYSHFCSKWKHICEDVCHNDTMSTWIKFYRELDDQWAERLMKYVYYEHVTMAYTFTRFNELLQRTEYLYRLHPTRWIDDKFLCLKMDKAQAERESKWLNFLGQPHEIIEVEGNH